jgi:hypothetical protein
MQRCSSEIRSVNEFSPSAAKALAWLCGEPLAEILHEHEFAAQDVSFAI